MGLEPTTLRDLVGCSNHWATGDSMVSEGQFVGLDWNRIARLHSQVLVSTCENSLTASRCHIKAYQDAANQPPKWAYTIGGWNKMHLFALYGFFFPFKSLVMMF